jgi:hypothetical protein
MFREPSTPLEPEQMAMRKQVLEQIELYPHSFDMTDWEFIPEEYADPKTCHTTRCMAGWAQYFARGEVFEFGNFVLGIPPVYEDAILLMGFTEAEFGYDPDHDENGLFYLSDTEAVQRLRQLIE